MDLRRVQHVYHQGANSSPKAILHQGRTKHRAPCHVQYQLASAASSHDRDTNSAHRSQSHLRLCSLRSTSQRHSVVARAAKSSAQESALKQGDLVEFSKDKDKSSLGLVQEPDGKKNVWVLEGNSGRRVSITPKQVVFKLPGGPYTEGQLHSIISAVGADVGRAQDDSISGSALLADAWEMAVADSVPLLSLEDLAGLVLEDDSYKNLYRMYQMLAADKLYFKQVSAKGAAAFAMPSYEPRSEEAVSAQKAMLQAEAVAREEELGWANDVKASLAARKRSDQPSPEEWASGKHAKRIAALKELATQEPAIMKADTLKLAQQSLQLAGISTPSAGASFAASGRNGAVEASPLSEAAANLLVDIRAWRRHEPIAALRKGVSMQFPASIEQQAQDALDRPIADSCADIRIDLTHLPCYTIDDQGTTEIDDGLSIEYLDAENASSDSPQGGPEPTSTQSLPAVRIWIHIADPTRWLNPRSGLVEHARSRGRTLYFPFGSVPMFPRVLSDGPFSLRAKQDCCALSVGVVLRSDGSISDARIAATKVHVSDQLTYDAADEFLANQGVQNTTDNHPRVARELLVLRTAADARRQHRAKQGSIEIPIPEPKVQVDAAQLDSVRPSVGVTRISQWDSLSRGLVAEMMILAGEAAGTLGVQHNLVLPYRSQQAPNLPSQQLIDSHPEGPCRGFLLKRCMTRSEVGPQPARHASLALDAYVQITSPIRRWADIVAHFNLKAWLAGLPAPYSPADVDAISTAAASETMRGFGVAERVEDQYWITEYFRQAHMSKNDLTWPAMVLGWVRQDLKLAAVLIDELGYEVVVKTDVEVYPGDTLQLALLEARPVAGVLRFYIAEYTSVGGPGGELPVDDTHGWGDDVPSIEELFARMEAEEAAQQLQADSQTETTDQDVVVEKTTAEA